jgi:hypothetical protein
LNFIFPPQVLLNNSKKKTKKKDEKKTDLKLPRSEIHRKPTRSCHGQRRAS